MARILLAVLLSFAALAAAAAEFVLVVHPSVPAETLAKLRELAGEQPRGLTFADAGAASTMHRAAERFAQSAHIEITQVAYPGSAKALAAVLSGEAAAAFTGAEVAAAALKTGKLRALAVTGDGRLARLPGVPTFAEAGLAGFRPQLP
jgi:tripartite-type tricarboxylate transporter receptor subunit TctC